MPTTIADETVLQKTKELCETILAQPSMRAIRQRIDAFMDDARTRTQYDDLVAKGQALQEKQQNSVPLTSEEVDDFEKCRRDLLDNPVARGYLDAQEELHEVQHSVQRLVGKTLELGRVPTEDEMCEGGGCGNGCSCGH